MALRERIITDVEEAGALREAGLLWRCTQAGSKYYLGAGDDAWLPDSIRSHMRLDATRNYGHFYILLEE